MRYDIPPLPTPAPKLCRYGASQLSFRSPARDLTRPYIAVLGGSDTFASDETHPYPDVLQGALHHPCVNFGTRDGGLETVLRDSHLLQICSHARALVLECGRFDGLSNRYYMVHPRQTNRIFCLSPRLLEIWPESKDMRFDFVDEMSAALPPALAEEMETELCTAWTARLRMFLTNRKIPTLIFALDPKITASFAPLTEAFPHHVLLDLGRDQQKLDTTGHAVLGATLARALRAILA